MGSPYLNNDESIILSTHNVVINTIPAEAILTNQRLILVDARHTQLRPQDIPFAAIETVTIGDNSDMDPVLSISVVLPGETRQQLGMVFTQPPRTRRAGERDEWAVKLKEASNAEQHGHGGVHPADLLPPWVPGPLPAEAEDDEGAGAEEEKFRNPPLIPRKPRTPAPGSRKMLIAGGIVVLVIIIALAGYVLAPSLTGTGGGTTEPAATPAVTGTPATPASVQTTAPATPAPTQAPVVTPVSTSGVTTQPTVAAVSGIPQSGIWVRVSYAGKFAGSVGTPGRMKDVAGEGDQMYQIPAKNEIVEANIQKLDDSGNVLTVIFYNDGTEAKTGNITSPHGTLDIHADLRTVAPAAAAGNTTAANQTAGS